MTMWDVDYSYSICVEAETEIEGEKKANQQWDKKPPKRDEMYVEVSNADE